MQSQSLCKLGNSKYSLKPLRGDPTIRSGTYTVYITNEKVKNQYLNPLSYDRLLNIVMKRKNDVVWSYDEIIWTG